MRNSLILARSTMLSAPHVGYLPAYANSLTGLYPDLYDAMDVVSRELTGFIAGASRSANAERAAVGQNVRYTVAPTMAAFDITPAMQVPEPPDTAFVTQFMAITKARAVPWGFTGEDQKLLNTGQGYRSAQSMLIAQALRTLVNEIEGDLAAEAASKASRAYGTAGTTPFAGDKMTDMAQLRKILDDNGAPQTGRSLVMDTAAGANMRSMYNLTRANEAGTALTLRQGELMDLLGFSVKESAKVGTHTKGTAAAPPTNAAGYAVGATVITLAAASTGTITAGEVIQFAGDANKYVVVTGDTDVSNGGTVTISAPGLRVAIPAAATAITLTNTYTANVAFSADALHVAIRPPAMPEEGDLASDRMLLTDPRSGVTFEFSIWPGYRKVRGEVSAAWGVHASKRENIALLLG